jgi:hypothetical protein
MKSKKEKIKFSKIRDPVLKQALMSERIYNEEKCIQELPQFIKYESKIPKNFMKP